MKNIYLILFVLFVLLGSCTKKFEEFNTDVKNPATVTGEALFSKAELSLVDQTESTDVNLNIFKIMAQYWTETTYTDEANYNIVTRTIPDNIFQIYYVGNITKQGGFLSDFKEAAKLIALEVSQAPGDDAVKANKQAIIELLNVYSFQNLVDIFGNVPYSQALDITDITPAYDDAATIYQDLLNRVDAALSNLDPASASFGSADLIYGGDVNKMDKIWQFTEAKVRDNSFGCESCPC